MNLNEDWRSRTALLIGGANVAKLQNSHVLVAGLGGVGAYTAEMLCRAGIGKMTIVDGDQVTPTNRNRQLPALLSTQGKRKTQLMAERLMDINPELKLATFDLFLKGEITAQLLQQPFDYVVDAIDTLSPKVYFIMEALHRNLKLVSSMGAGGKMNPALIQVADIENSHGCKLAYFIRKRLHKFNIRSGFKAVFSPEPVAKDAFIEVTDEQNKKTTVGTISFMPAIFGCTCASVVIRDLIDEKNDE
jgi:tRNA threonylcarbamoyladenosine dehydratase